MRLRVAGRVGAVAVLAAGAIAVAGCSGGDEQAAPEITTAAPPATTPADTEAAETTSLDTTTAEDHDDVEATETGAKEMGAGHDLYVSAGCGGCHGDDGQGTEVGPALPGHGEAIVIRQVRSPLDSMPSYSAAKLSDEDLHEIAEYIASLAPEETHVEPVKVSNVLAMHHWMALASIDGGDQKDAMHHVDHIIDVVKGKHLAAMKEAKEHLEAGDAHEAEHLIEELLAGTAKPDLTLNELHLRLALTAVEGRNAKEAIHQMRHFLTVAKAKDKAAGREVLSALQAGDLHEAEHEIDRLLGREPHED